MGRAAAGRAQRHPARPPHDGGLPGPPGRRRRPHQGRALLLPGRGHRLHPRLGLAVGAYGRYGGRVLPLHPHEERDEDEPRLRVLRPVHHRQGRAPERAVLARVLVPDVTRVSRVPRLARLPRLPGAGVPGAQDNRTHQQRRPPAELTQASDSPRVEGQCPPAAEQGVRLTKAQHQS